MDELERTAAAAYQGARSALRRGAFALGMLAILGVGNPCSAAGVARLELSFDVRGIAAITDLAAQMGSSPGSIDLSWTEPLRDPITPPAVYEIRVSSTGQIDAQTVFDAARPLSELSPSPIPTPGTGGGVLGLVVTGLEPAVTYYFAIIERDSALPPAKATWLRSVAKGWNLNNFAQARPSPPNAVTDLAAAPTLRLGELSLTWTAPTLAAGVSVASYTLVYSSQSVAALGGDTTAWFNLSAATRVAVMNASPAGALESRLVTGLPIGLPFYFGVKAIDVLGDSSLIDTRAAGVATQSSATARGALNVTALTGAVSGSIALSWTEPATANLTAPLRYVMRASSVANINDDAAFAAAAPLSALSSSDPPPPGAGGAVAFNVTGLVPGVTYYFAIREQDSSGTPFRTVWARDLGLGISVNNFAPAHFLPNAPDAVSNLSALPGGVEGQVALSWTAPRNANFVPMSYYDVRFNSISAASLGGDTTAWWNLAASSAIIVPAQSPGKIESLAIGGLHPLVTWYVAIKGYDVRGEVSDIDDLTEAGAQPFSRPRNDPPPTPSGLSAAAGLKRATLSWTDLSAAQKRVEFGFYAIYRSTEQATGFVTVTTTTATSYVDLPLTSSTTYYYRVSAREQPGGLESVLSSTVAATPFSLPPMEPMGFVISRTSDTISFSWSTTTRYDDGTAFLSPSAPEPDELLGYRVYRATAACDPVLSFSSSETVTSASFSTYTAGNLYYYHVRSFNSVGPSTATMTFSSYGDLHFFLDDCKSEVALPDAMAPLLSAGSNDLGGDVLIARERRPQDTGGQVLQSAQFKPLLNGVTELKNFHLPQPGRVKLHFATAGGVPVPQATPLGLAAAEPAGAGVANDAVKNLAMYWHNGSEYKKVYGAVDPIEQTVTVETPNLGLFQIRTLLRADEAVFDLSNLSSRVITPNDDGLNDLMIFTYDPGPRGISAEGTIYDLRGRVVARMAAGAVPNTLVWDGKMDGRAVSGGVYVYQIKGDGKVFNGTVVVAR